MKKKMSKIVLNVRMRERVRTSPQAIGEDRGVFERQSLSKRLNIGGERRLGRPKRITVAWDREREKEKVGVCKRRRPVLGSGNITEEPSRSENVSSRGVKQGKKTSHSRAENSGEGSM